MIRSKNKNFSPEEYRRIYLQSLGKYFQIILTELGLKTLNTLQKNNEGGYPFSLPVDGNWTTLGEVIEFSSNLNIQAKFSPETIINYVDIDAIDNSQYCIREVKRRSVSELSSRARRVLKKGYMLYSLVRPYLNNLALIETDKENFIGSTGFAVFKGTKLKNEFLKLILLTDYVRERFLEMLSGFNSPTITQEQFIQTPVPLISVDLQNPIINFLYDLGKDSFEANNAYFDKDVEEKIVNLHSSQLIGNQLLNEISNQQQNLQQLRQSILQEAVQGKLSEQNPSDEGADTLLKRIKAEKQKLIKEGKLKKEKELPPITQDEIPFELPKGWVWCRLGEIIRLQNGYAFQSSKYQTQGIRLVRNINIGHGVINWDEIAYYPEALKKEFIDFSLNENDILISLDRPLISTGLKIARVNSLDIPSLLLQRVARVNSKILQIESNYLYLWFTSSLFINEINPGRSNGVPHISTKEIENLLFPLPSLAEQQRIVAKVNKLQQQLNELESQVQQSREYAEQLLQAVLKEAFEEKGTVYEENEMVSMATEE